MRLFCHLSYNLVIFLGSLREKDEIMRSLSYNMVIWAFLPARVFSWEKPA